MDYSPSMALALRAAAACPGLDPGAFAPGSASEKTAVSPGTTKSSCGLAAFDRHSGRAQRDPESVSRSGCRADSDWLAPSLALALRAAFGVRVCSPASAVGFCLR